MYLLESVFFLFPIGLLGVYFIIRQSQRYHRLKKDVLVRIKYFNYIHFAFDHNLFPGYQQKAFLAPQDFAEMDHDVNFKTEMLHNRAAAYEDFLRIVHGLGDMRSCTHASLVCAAVLVWFLIFLATP